MPALAVPRPEPAGTDANAHRAAVPAALERRLRVCLGDELVDRLFGASSSEPLAERLMTQVMERFRRSRAESDFAVLFDLAAPVLQRRIRHRLRRYACEVDEGDVLQETLLNVYRYPDHFRCARDGAFKAWSSAILENALRRLMRGQRRRRQRFEEAGELLEATAADTRSDPVRLASDQESRWALGQSYLILLLAYQRVFMTLSGRERRVLHLVEVDRLRYREAAAVMGVRPEALKMVVFRARKRIHCRLYRQLAVPQAVWN
jgi:RNA polymerase sigma factor (sigma-70 family)